MDKVNFRDISIRLMQTSQAKFQKILRGARVGLQISINRVENVTTALLNRL